MALFPGFVVWTTARSRRPKSFVTGAMDGRPLSTRRANIFCRPPVRARSAVPCGAAQPPRTRRTTPATTTGGAAPIALSGGFLSVCLHASAGDSRAAPDGHGAGSTLGVSPRSPRIPLGAHATAPLRLPAAGRLILPHHLLPTSSPGWRRLLLATTSISCQNRRQAAPRLMFWGRGSPSYFLAALLGY